MLLVLDTETTGLVQSSFPDDHPAQPHLVQLGLVLIDEDSWTEHACVDLIIRPDGWKIPEFVSKIHGITQEIALTTGVPILTALSVYTNLRAVVDAIVGHNISFDLSVMRTEIARSNRTPTH